MKKPKLSLKMGLLTTIVICWVVPIVMVVTMAAILLGNSYRQSVQQELEVTADHAIGQVQMRLQDAIDSSKAVSYDGVVRSAYREFLQEGHGVQLYRAVNDYLSQHFSRDEAYQAVFVRFWNENIPQPYVISGDAAGSEIAQAIQDHMGPLLEIMTDADTEIRFVQLDGKLYMARNLLDSSFTSYATVVMMFDADHVFGALEALGVASDVQIGLDECRFRMDQQGKLLEAGSQEEPGSVMVYERNIDGHSFKVSVTTAQYDLWADNPWLRWAVAAVALMVLPLLIVIILLFSRHVSRPMQILAQANLRVQSGERGYQIAKEAPNVEFEKLYLNFNHMSEELQNQFERSYLEQQATQQARIKALQSQINPHFLNNTLEIINWEARIAENDRVSAMIEALSTMLDAALDRDGRTQIQLKEELGYVDAYLYIIQERLGESFRVHKQIDPTVLEQIIPRLILQPIVENAVEHDITARHGGDLWVRAGRDGKCMVLEVEHDGTMTDADRERIRMLLGEETATGSQLGLRNVHQRLKLMYGQRASLSVEETGNGTILARICFPAM